MADGFKKYILMHRELSVARMVLDEATGLITAVNAIDNAEHLPLGVNVRKGVVDRAALNEWWMGRAIPASRAGLRHALEELNIATPQKLLEKCLGLSLSDQYWICPQDSGLRWKDVNFFEHPFSGDVGEVLFGGAAGEMPDLMSPDNTSDGWLRKKWVIMDGERCLVKGGSGAIQQEPYNEVIASRIMEKLGIPHVEYMLQIRDGLPYSVCRDFITPKTEYIPAWYLMHTKAKPNHVSLYQHYLERCEALGIPGAERMLSQQIVLDYIIANEDRHQGNFGAVRDAETLEFISPAPVFDSGSALWFEMPTPQIRAGARTVCKPFKTTHEEQLQLVTDFAWLDPSALVGLDDVVREVFAGSDFVDGPRAAAIAGAVAERTERVKEYIRTREYGRDDATHDVKKNIAYSGKERRRRDDMER